MYGYYFFPENELPKGFKYPESYIKYMKYDSELKELDPYILFRRDEGIKLWSKILKEQYPTRNLIPIGKDNNSDDVFCFDGDDTSGDPKVYIVHTFASPGWEDRGYLKNFGEWLKFSQKVKEEYEKERKRK